MNVIEIDKLTKSYGKSRGIIDVSFQVKKGEILGFIGPNGAGKSTTIRTLLGYIRAESGRASIFGMDIAKDSVGIKRRTGYLPSEAVFVENRKAQDLLLYAAEFYGGGLREEIRSLASRLSLDLSRRVDDFSLGNRKKVAIVQALMHSPELLILDEPTSGLNPLVQKEFFDILLERRKAGATILFSSHAAILGSGLLVKDESLLSLPVSRKSIVMERVLAAMSDIFLFDAAILAIICTMDRDSRFWWIALGQFLLHMVFLSVGLLTAALKIRSKAPVVIPIGIVLATYFITILYGLSDKLEPVKYLSPFYYTDIKDIIVNSSLKLENVLPVCGMILLFTAAGGLVYYKRDMPA